MAKAKDKEQGFEESLSALEKIVAQLESGDLPLEKALQIFEEGVGLARRCQFQLEATERKVEVLLRERGEIKTIPFEPKAEAVNGGNDKQVNSDVVHLPNTFTDESVGSEIENMDDGVPF